MDSGDKVDVAKTVLDTLNKKNETKIADAILISVVLHMCEVLSDSINALSIQGKIPINVAHKHGVFNLNDYV